MNLKPSATFYTDPLFVLWRTLQRLAVVIGVVALTACGGDSSSVMEAPPTANYLLGGTVSGVSASGLVLANAGDTATISSGASTFDFATLL